MNMPGHELSEGVDHGNDGLVEIPSCMPVARQRARAPAIFLPWVVVRERYWGMTLSEYPNLTMNYPPNSEFRHPAYILGTTHDHIGYKKVGRIGDGAMRQQAVRAEGRA